MNTQHFGILRLAVRAARAAGFTCTRAPNGQSLPGQARERMIDGPERGPYRNAAWFTPYVAQRILGECGSERYHTYGLSYPEIAALNITEAHFLFAWFDADSEVEFSAYECKASSCGDCGVRFMSADLQSTHAYVRGMARDRAHYVCEGCADDDYTRWNGGLYADDDCIFVEDLGERRPESYVTDSGDFHYHESDGCWYTYPQDDEEDEDSEHYEGDDSAFLQSYGSDIFDTHGWPEDRARKELLFGVELEVEAISGTFAGQRDVAEALGGKDGDGANYICAHDGSLTHGVEVITLPDTLAGHMSGKRMPWAKALKSIAKIAKGGSGTENCGMHIHINRAALTTLQVGKMLVFVNSPRMQGLVEKIAQRSGSSYAVVRRKVFTDGRAVQSDSRYEAINISGKGTVELRIFRSNTRPERVYKNIEFAHALVTYCRDASMVDVENPFKFLAWIGTKGKDYPHLARFLDATLEDAHTLVGAA